MFENPRRGRQARNFTTNVPKILDLKSSCEQIYSENCRWVPLFNGGLSVKLVHDWERSDRVESGVGDKPVSRKLRPVSNVVLLPC